MTKYVNAEEDWINLRNLDFCKYNFKQLRILVSEVIEDRKL